MNNPIISMIAACAENRAIGRDNKLLWHIPEDFKYFKNKTAGHVVIMGKKTYDSIGRPLPNRTNIVITRDINCKIEDCIVVNSLEEALEKAKFHEKKGEIFIIGGAQIYNLGMKYADKLYITLVKGAFDADAFFPDYSEFKNIISQIDGESNELEYSFFELVR
jgi:dihydrofolate reductase